MHKCRVCGNPAENTVGSYQYTSWICEEHIETFVLLCTHWLYMEHKPVPYGYEEIVVVDEAVCVDITGDIADVKRAVDVLGWEQPTNVSPDYSDALYDPEARGFARPHPKHLRVYPRWTGMETHNADEKHGEVRVTEEDEDTCRDVEEIDEKDYASKGIIWDSPTIYTKG